MSYILEMLTPGEQIVCEAQVSKLAIIGSALMFSLTLYPGGLTGLFTTKLALTNKRLIGKRGWIRQQNLVLPHANIETVRVRQGLIGSLFDLGTITITAKDGRRVAFKGIACPLIIQQEIEEAVEEAVLGKKLSAYAPA